MINDLKGYILYGIGATCERMVKTWSKVNPDLFHRIICYSDSRPETWGGSFCGKPVIAPDDITRYDYDKIIIATELFAEEVFLRLTEIYRLPADRIVIASPPSSGMALSAHMTPAGTSFSMDCGQPYRYHLYLERTPEIMEWCTRDWFIDEPATAHTIHNAIILPARHHAGLEWQGGLCDETGCFLEGHRRINDSSTVLEEILSGYPIPEEIIRTSETVIYGGLLFAHFGHIITESLSRLWYYLDYPDCRYRYVFLSQGIRPEYLEFIYMLGIRHEQILIIDEPMQFANVIVPEQTVFFNGGYRKKALGIYNTIRDSVVPQTHEKIYLTRTGHDDRTVNEKYFENQFRNMGYQVIAPEQLSVREQVALMAGARQIACINGTLPHQILFSQDDVEITILQRTTAVLAGQFWINQARKAQCHIVDISLNFLPGSHIGPCFLLLPTVFWKQYLSGCGVQLGASANCSVRDFAPEMFEYMEKWAAGVKHFPFFMWVPSFSIAALLAELTAKIHDEVTQNTLGEQEKLRLRARLGLTLTETPTGNSQDLVKKLRN